MKTQKLKLWIGIIFNAFSLIVLAGSIKDEKPGYEFEKDYQNFLMADSLVIENPVMHFSKVDTSYKYFKIGSVCQSKDEKHPIVKIEDYNSMEHTVYHLGSPFKNNRFIWESKVLVLACN